MLASAIVWFDGDLSFDNDTLFDRGVAGWRFKGLSWRLDADGHRTNFARSDPVLWAPFVVTDAGWIAGTRARCRPTDSQALHCRGRVPDRHLRVSR
jgi:hypothetical protein